jgi:hypothetical protein
MEEQGRRRPTAGEVAGQALAVGGLVPVIAAVAAVQQVGTDLPVTSALTEPAAAALLGLPSALVCLLLAPGRGRRCVVAAVVLLAAPGSASPSTPSPIRCQPDGPSLLHRIAADRHEYIRLDGDVVIRADARLGVRQDLLRSAVTGARPLADSEIDDFLPAATGRPG